MSLLTRFIFRHSSLYTTLATSLSSLQISPYNPFNYNQNDPFNEIRDFLISRYQYSSSNSDALQLHLQIIKHGFCSDLFLVNTLINIYARYGDLFSAHQVFDEMPERNLVSWACLISGFTNKGAFGKACSLFRCMISEGFVPNQFAFGSVLRACHQLGPDGLMFGMQVHGLVSKTRFCDDVLVSNVLISMYGSCFLGSINYARKVFDEIHDRNLVSWNSIISVYSLRGELSSACELFSDMQIDGIGFGFKPSEYTLCSIITAAAASPDSSSCLIEQMFARVNKSGFLEDLYVGSALVSGFARFGLIGSARKIFEQMSARNAVTLNGLVAGLVKQKRGEEAVDIFRNMQHLVEINLDSYVVLLSAFAEFNSVEEGMREGEKLHAYVIRSALGMAKIAIGNGLINMYAKCGSINSACSVFESMEDKDLISWNSLISRLDQNEHFEEAIAKYCQLRNTELKPSNFTLISCLSSCASLGWVREGEQIHAEALKFGLDFDVSVSNALIALYAEGGCTKDCQKLFSLMPEHDQISWNSIIGALADSETQASEAVMYFIEMMRSNWRLSGVTFVNTLSAVSSLPLSELCPQLHAVACKFCVMNDTTVENAFISNYGKCGKMEDCESIFSRMSERRDEVTWNSMISGYIHNEQLGKAMDLVWFMMQNGQRLDHFTYATVLSACASVATLERGMEVHACEIRAGLEFDVVVGSAIVDMYAKCGRIEYASRFFELMPMKNVYSWNSMISGYARHGNADSALDIYTRMKEARQLPNHVTFVAVLSACSHGGLVEEGFEHFESMSKNYGLAPQMEHFSCMVDLLGRSGQLDKVDDFINKMPMKPNALIWRTILGACSRTSGRNSELGRRAADMLLELEPSNAVNYVLLSNMYAAGSKWENMSKARSSMRLAATKKEAGCSWVTMKDGVHVFVAGDNSHPENDAIYSKLKELLMKLRDVGYVPQTSFALYDLEVEHKEELLSYHSEKLAIAFVLTRKSVSTIRIMKNLRVCGDCHLAFKYLSKIIDRQIVLRDSNRFHHFSDGKCSCGDYW